MLFERFEDSGLSQFSYAVGCPGAEAVAIVDPRRDVDVYETFAADRNVEITHVLETHVHADFASGARELAERTGASLCLSAYDICSSTCNIKFGRPGFSDELSFALCDDACRDDLRSCIATGDDAILRQNSRGRDAIKKLTDQVTVKRPG